MTTRTKSRWGQITQKYPEASCTAKLLISDLAELADLKKLKRAPYGAMDYLERNIKTNADFLIQGRDACVNKVGV